MALYRNTIIFCILTLFWSLEAGPTVVAKFGPQECPWSEQLKKEVWNSPAFNTLLEAEGIEKNEVTAQAEDQDLPIFTLFSSQGEKIGSLGFLLITPENYVDLFKEMISIHQLCFSKTELTTEERLHFYRKSQHLHMTECEETLLREGLQQDAGVDFLIEKYAKVIKDHPRRAHKIKKEIRLRKPEDSETEWALALISFQAKRDKLNNHAQIVHPLEKFLRHYGVDHNCAWKCHLVLAEFYKETHQLEKSKQHAEYAIDGAPIEFKRIIEAS